jgi:solute carrier family 25 citrate transporter 1
MNYSGNQIYINMLSGALAGPASLISIYPSEYLKTQQQLKINQNNNILQIAKNTFKKQGIIGFYKGLSNLLYFNVPRTTIQFTTFETTSHYYKNYFSPKTSYLLGGLTAGFMSGLFIGVPAENLKVYKINLFNSNKNSKINFIELNKDFIKNVGFKSYYNGATNGIMKECMSQGTRFFLYASLMDYYLNLKKNEKKPIDGALIGGVAGSLGALLNNPIDAVQTRLQSNYDKKYTGVIDCYKQMYKNEGIKSFYKGATLRVLRTIPGMMVYFYTYEFVNKKLKNL